MHPEFLNSPAMLSLGVCQGSKEKVFHSAMLMVLPKRKEAGRQDRGEEIGVPGNLGSSRLLQALACLIASEQEAVSSERTRTLEHLRMTLGV